MKPLILASSSPWRQQILAMAGLSCQALAPDVDEERITAPAPGALAVARARAKAVDVARRAPGALVIGADQVAHLDGEAFGKPRDDLDWITRLRALRGRTHTLTTGVALAEEGEVETFEVHTNVRFRADLSDAELLAYVAIGEARGCAGGYQAEHRGAWLIEAIDGDWWNVIGLPLFPLIGRLRARGWRLSEALVAPPRPPPG